MGQRARPQSPKIRSRRAGPERHSERRQAQGSSALTKALRCVAGRLPGGRSADTAAEATARGAVQGAERARRPRARRRSAPGTV